MITATKNYLRRHLALLMHGRRYPILLPHARVVDGALVVYDRPPERLAPALARALTLCDGSRTFARVIGESRARTSALSALIERDFVLNWRNRVVGEAHAAGNPAPQIILSPHPDDAPLCMGGIMLKSPPGSIIILDVFMRSAWTRFPVELNDVARIQTVRWAEERLVARLSGASLVSLDLPEALLRQHIIDDVFDDAPMPWDQEVMVKVREAVVAMTTSHPQATWNVPLAVGGHLDHRIVRDAAFQALRETGHIAQLRFYEDLPYAESLEGAPDFSTALPGHKLVSSSYDIDDTINWKLELNRVYFSQLSWEQIRRLRDYAERIGKGRPVERLWRIA